ncbi:hypothetical protein PtB15_13B383 [Puccinia triticina]|nr:hypothetical protein PtB15_13B383 [Puccinia triticina]
MNPQSSSKASQEPTRPRADLTTHFYDGEDERLVLSWIEVTKLFKNRPRPTDEVFWSTLAAVFNSHFFGFKRSEKVLQTRWEQVREDTLTFSAYYREAKASGQSDRTEAGLIDKAMEMFQARRGRAFGLKIEWHYHLRYLPGWREGEAEEAAAGGAGPGGGASADAARARTSSDTIREHPPHTGSRPPAGPAGLAQRRGPDLADEAALDALEAANERESLRMDAARLQIEQDAADCQLMQKDLAQLPDDEARQFFSLKKQAILAKLQAAAPRPSASLALVPRPAI